MMTKTFRFLLLLVLLACPSFLCAEEAMTPALFRKIVSAPADSTPPPKELAALPGWPYSKQRITCKFANGESSEDEADARTWYVAGKYIVNTMRTKLYGIRMESVAVYDPATKSFKGWTRHENLLIAASAKFDFAAKTGVCASSYKVGDDTFEESGKIEFSDERIFVRVIVLKNGVPFMVREVDETPVTTKQKPLAALPPGSKSRVYRLSIAPAWGDTFAFTLSGGETKPKLLMERFHYGEKPQRNLVEIKEVALSDEDFAAFEALVAKSGYEKMGETDPDMGLDGDSWSLETARAGFHHAAVRWCPASYDIERRGTKGYVAAFRWAADQAGVTARITNKGGAIFDRKSGASKAE